jgi:arabinan endo-1,5-alpha-L-arabinosidase
MSGWIGTALGRVCLLALALASSQCGEDSSAARTIGAQQDNESSTNGPGSEVVATDPALLPAGAEPTGSTPTRTNEQLNPSGLAETPSSAAADAGAGAMAPAVAGDRCDVGVYDAANPPRSLALSGSLGAHDPVILAAGGSYHYFSTGNGISVKTSPDLLRWTQGAAVFATIPAWFQQLVPEYAPRSIWAPDISYFGGQYHLYYSVSSFGSNRSCIGHATRADLDTGEWTDHEAMFCSNQPGQDDNYNAIDPNLVLDEAGTAWLAFGSFWSGIKLLRLDQNGERAGTELYSLASRGGGAIEGPFIVRRCGFYYLFVSFDACCRGVDSTYNIRVGRSPELLGPYVDKAGTALMNGGGSLVLQGGGDWAAVGHNAILIDGTRAYNVYHAYAATNGASQLRISELAWDADGWPVSAGP